MASPRDDLLRGVSAAHCAHQRRRIVCLASPREDLLRGVSAENRDAVARIVEHAERALDSWTVVHSDFHSPPVVAEALAVLGRMSDTVAVAWGGYPQAERCRQVPSLLLRLLPQLCQALEPCVCRGPRYLWSQGERGAGGVAGGGCGEPRGAISVGVCGGGQGQLFVRPRDAPRLPRGGAGHRHRAQPAGRHCDAGGVGGAAAGGARAGGAPGGVPHPGKRTGRGGVEGLHGYIPFAWLPCCFCECVNFTGRIVAARPASRCGACR